MSAVSFRQRRLGGGTVEIAVLQADKLVGVITHPCPRADWFWHPPGRAPRQRFKTKKAALEAVERQLGTATQDA